MRRKKQLDEFATFQYRQGTRRAYLAKTAEMAYNRRNDKGEWGLALRTVFQLVDKSFHMALSNDCVHLPRSEDAAVKYHVFGEAVLAPKETQHEMFRTCVPLLKLAEENEQS
jgi:hypothetical protein